MKTLKQEYGDLLQLTKKLIAETLENNGEKPSNWIVSEPDTYNYFKNYALQKRVPPENKKIEPTKAPYQAPPVYKPAPVIAEIKQETVAPTITKDPEKEPEKLPETNEKQFFELQPLSKASPHDLTDIRKLVQQVAPRQVILDGITALDPQIVIVSDVTDKKQEAFLNNFAKALDLFLAPCQLIASQKFKQSDFSQLKMVIQIDQSNCEINEPVRLFQISDLSRYFKEPKEKLNLWEKALHVFLS